MVWYDGEPIARYWSGVDGKTRTVNVLLIALNHQVRCPYDPGFPVAWHVISLLARATGLAFTMRRYEFDATGG